MLAPSWPSILESRKQQIFQADHGRPKRLVSSLSALEAAIVIHARKGSAGIRELDLLLHSAAVLSLDADQVLLLRAAYEKYGKGHHPAALNLGDCCSYTLSRFSGEPLLFKGNDFSRTDLAVAERSRHGTA